MQTILGIFISGIVSISALCTPSAPSETRIAVVGGGLAGTTAAHRLRKKSTDNGSTIDLYEARGRLGGRVFSVKIGTEIGELGAQNISDGGKAPYLLGLAQDLGLSVVRKRRSRKPQLLWPFYKDGVLRDDSERIAEYAFTPETLHETLDELQQSSQTMQEVLEKLFPDDPDLVRSYAIRLATFEGAAATVLSAKCSDTLYHMILGGISSIQPAGSPRWYTCIEGGNSMLPEAIGKSLGNRAHLNMPLRAIEFIEGEYVLTFADDEVVRADIVILAIPCPVFNDIDVDASVIPNEQLARIRALPYGTNSKILIPVLNSWKTPISATNGRIVLFQGGDSHFATMFYIDHFGAFDAQTISTVFEQDEALLNFLYIVDPRFTDGVTVAQDVSNAVYHGPVGHCWLRDPYAQGSYSVLAAGFEDDFTETAEYHGEQVKALFAPRNNGTLFFAGEHTTLMFDILGTMEAAVESGERVARIILKDLENKGQETQGGPKQVPEKLAVPREKKEHAKPRGKTQKKKNWRTSQKNAKSSTKPINSPGSPQAESEK